ncbi:MAG: patatin-like phospholipase family protein [Gammaproteobacteria bacterium]|nr:patatin-like phospholipase family protein [Gammaproteobacteria bacterium]
MKPLSIGLALSGGTARAVTHVGVLKALIEDDIQLDYVAGTSGGSIVATLFASGMDVAEMELTATNLSWRKLASIKLTKLGFVSSKGIESLVRQIVGDIGFGELKLPCAVPVTDLGTGEKEVFLQGSVARVVRASCSIPQIFLPVEIGGRYYVDGGLVEYLPVQTVRSLGEQFTIAVNLSTGGTSDQRPNHILHLIMQMTHILAQKNAVISENLADFIIRPNVNSFSAFDFSNAADLMEVGYHAARKQMPELRRALQSSSRPFSRYLHRLQAKLSNIMRQSYPVSST